MALCLCGNKTSGWGIKTCDNCKGNDQYFIIPSKAAELNPPTYIVPPEEDD